VSADQKIDDGGQAFPSMEFHKIGECSTTHIIGGMTYRAWAAGKALQAILGATALYEYPAPYSGKYATIIAKETIKQNASLAVKCADALIEALKK
jgi:hypothetical protein